MMSPRRALLWLSVVCTLAQLIGMPAPSFFPTVSWMLLGFLCYFLAEAIRP